MNPNREIPAPDVPERPRGVTLLIAMVILIWSLEILYIQQVTTLPMDHMAVGVIVKDAARRMVLNIAACTMLVSLLNRLWLFVAFAIGLVCSTVLLVCADYMKAPLSWYTMTSQWSEGLAVADHGLAIVRWPVVVVLLVAIVIKVALRELVHRRHLARSCRRRRALWAACIYLLMAVGLAGVHKPIHQIKMGSPQYIYGYVVGWVAEATFFGEQSIFEEALAKAAITSDRLTSVEGPMPMGRHIAIVQVESLDVEVVETDIAGVPVTPFLRDLRERAMVYHVTPFHRTGSSEADFTLLTTATPNGRIPPFKVRGYPYHATLPRLAQDHGYEMIALHGYSGSFFNRRPAYAQMGFAGILFSEDLRRLGHIVSTNGVEDDSVFQQSAKMFREAARPTIHFIITFTSHGPFNRLPEDEIELFLPPADLAEAYLNSMRYVDRALQRYYDALPDGTTLIIYSDHDSQVTGYRDDRPDVEIVPWLIARKGDSLAERQITRNTPLATSGDLTQLDMATFVRNSVAATGAMEE